MNTFKLFRTVLFAYLLTLSLTIFAQKSGEGGQGSGGGNWTESDLKYQLNMLSKYFQSKEAQIAFPEVVAYDQRNPKEPFYQVLLAIRPVLTSDPVFDQRGNPRDCFSSQQAGARYFKCNIQSLPPAPGSSITQAQKSEYFGSMYRLVLHEAFVNIGLELPAPKKSSAQKIPSVYDISSRLDVHLEYFPTWLPGKGPTGDSISVQPTELKVGNSIFRSGYITTDIHPNIFIASSYVIAGKLTVDSSRKVINIKWFQFDPIISQSLDFETLLGEKNKLPSKEVKSPILDLASDNLNRYPRVNFPSKQKSIDLKVVNDDPYLPAYEEQYFCANPKEDKCFRMTESGNKYLTTAYITTTPEGSITFYTDSSFRPADFEPKYWDGFSYDTLYHCDEKSCIWRKFNSVTLNTFDPKDLITKRNLQVERMLMQTKFAVELVSSNFPRLRQSVKECLLVAKSVASSYVTSAVIESIQGKGIEKNCISIKLAPLLRMMSSKNTESAEYVEINNMVGALGQKCKYETWQNPRNVYELLDEKCMNSNVDYLDMYLKAQRRKI